MVQNRGNRKQELCRFRVDKGGRRETVTSSPPYVRPDKRTSDRRSAKSPATLIKDSVNVSTRQTNRPIPEIILLVPWTVELCRNGRTKRDMPENLPAVKINVYFTSRA
jgi:hypothetical protein